MKNLLVSFAGIILFFQLSLGQSLKTGQVNTKFNPVVSGFHTLSIHVRDTVTHDSVFKFLSEKLRLPVSYNPVFYSKRRYAGVFAGNLVLEPCGPYSNFKYAYNDFRAIFFGLNFESLVPIPEAVTDLSDRGIKVYSMGRWITFGDSLLCGENIVISVAEKRRIDKTIFDSLRLEMQNDGPGIEYVKTILIGYKNNAGLQKWEKLVAPADISGNTWKFDDQLEFLFDASDIREVKGIIFKVKSLKKARRYLVKNDLLGNSSGKRISMDKSKAFGLSVYFEE